MEDLFVKLQSDYHSFVREAVIAWVIFTHHLHLLYFIFFIINFKQ